MRANEFKNTIEKGINHSKGLPRHSSDRQTLIDAAGSALALNSTVLLGDF